MGTILRDLDPPGASTAFAATRIYEALTSSPGEVSLDVASSVGANSVGKG